MNSIIWIPWHHWLAASEVMNMPDIWSTEEAEADILDIWDQLHWLQSQKATDLWFLMAHMLGFDWNLELSCKFHELCAFVKLIMLLRCQDVKVKRFMTYCDTMTQGLDRVLFVHSSGHEVREVSTWRCRKSNTKKIWGYVSLFQFAQSWYAHFCYLVRIGTNLSDQTIHTLAIDLWTVPTSPMFTPGLWNWLRG